MHELEQAEASDNGSVQVSEIEISEDNDDSECDYASGKNQLSIVEEEPEVREELKREARRDLIQKMRS